MTTSHPITRTFAAMLAAGLLALLLVPLAVRSSYAAANVYYVALTGSDSNSGRSADAPFKSIQKASTWPSLVRRSSWLPAFTYRTCSPGDRAQPRRRSRSRGQPTPC